MSFDRREFLIGTFGATILAALPAELLAERAPAPAEWSSGRLRHLLPTVSDTEMLIKASFLSPLTAAPTLRIGTTSVRGTMNDTRGEFWQFRARGLRPGRRHTLALIGSNGRALCDSWELSTFPSPAAQSSRCRVLFFSCAGGHEALTFLPLATRRRLLRRALSFAPDAVVANGDHVYWDLLSPVSGHLFGNSPQGQRIAGTFSRSALVFGGDNETVLRRAVDPQIGALYGTDFRSTPVFFVQDDHDYFDNDDATDAIVTFPPSAFMLQLARATQRLYYPEFLPDPTRPAGLPWSSAGDRASGLSESFGTLRFGGLVEVLLYDVRRTMTMAGPTAVFLDPEAERWVIDRTRATTARHLVHAPSNPPGWSAGKWGEWYPDMVSSDGTLSTNVRKPYWQDGWLAQHDRLLNAFSSARELAPLAISGDLHAVAMGRISRIGSRSLEPNPITSVLPGTIGTRPGGWPSGRRGIGPSRPHHLDLSEQVPPIEQHGFTIVDFTPDGVDLRLFKWDVRTDTVVAIDSLQPFHSTHLPRPG